MEKMCCAGFKNLLDNAGQRGVAALAQHTNEGVGFLLQSRGVAYEDEPKLKPEPIDLIINIACTSGLRFCPACGRRLKEFADAWSEYFEQLAKEHEKFHSMP